MARCKHCGITTGKGKRHKPDCKREKPTPREPSEPREMSPLDGRTLRKMDVDELLNLRDKVDNAIAGKAPEIKAKISAMQETLKTIQGK